MNRLNGILAVILIGAALGGCGLLGPAPGQVEPGQSGLQATATPDLGQPDGVAQAFLDAWAAGDFTGMYSLLSPNSQAEYTLDDFTRIYNETASVMGLVNLHSLLLSVLPSATGTTAQAAFRVVYQTEVIGPIEQELTMRMVSDGGRWGIAWTPALIFPQLAGGNTLQLEVETPARANIYDRNGLWLVSANAAAVTLTIVPGEVSENFEDDMLVMLSEMLRMPPDEIKRNYQGFPPDQVWPLGDVDLETFNAYYNEYYSYPGLGAIEKTGRRYFNLLAPHVLGYAGFIQPEQMEYYQGLGYRGDEIVGQSGLEAWGERYLAGTRGGVLRAYTPGGQFFAEIARKDPLPAQSLYTTLDRNLQVIVQDALEEAYRTASSTWAPTAGGASVVVLDVNNGDVLAMASYPYFDPNVFYPYNNHPLGTESYIGGIVSDPLVPLLNRATQGQYPPGSIFKVVSMVAALESGVFGPDDTFTCTGVWTELGANSMRYDWKEGGHGTLTLRQALTASCNPWFYHIGLNTGQVDYNLLATYARELGLGQNLNIETDENEGLVPDPDWLWQARGEEWTLENSVNMAIGQGDLLVTPLQIATMIAAVANGGTIYQPHLVDRIGLIGEEPTVVTEPVVLRQADISPETLAIVRESMRGVTSDQEIGTATWRLGSLQIATAGKTGTAQVSQPGAYPHAWFGGFVPYDDPELAIVVMIENGGQGSGVAAPIFRRIVEKYYDLPVLNYPNDWMNPEFFDFVTDEGAGE